MKKTKELESFENILNLEELKLLKGGEVYNSNGYYGCVCKYKNKAAVVSNGNFFSGCSCECI